MGESSRRISPYMFWGTTQLGFANYWQVVHGVTPILASARLLPEGEAVVLWMNTSW
jgi:hypothetical protein